MEQYPVSITFQHISSEYFLLYLRSYSTEPRSTTDDFEVATDGLSKAEFRLGEDGQVKEMGVVLEPAMWDAKIWFNKAEAENSDGYEKDFAAGSSAVRMESSQGANDAKGQRKLFSKFGPGLAPLFE